MTEFHIHIDRELYKPGDTVTGHVRISITHRDTPFEIFIGVCGKEICKNEDDALKIFEKYRKILEFKKNCDLSNILVPYQFKLPLHIPSSTPSTSDTYSLQYRVFVTAHFNCVNSIREQTIWDNFSVKHLFPSHIDGEIIRAVDKNLTRCCGLIQRGNLSIECGLDKVWYKPGEIVKLWYDVGL
jgi:hypothetical protein